MKKILIVLLISTLFLISGCVKTISEVKNDDYLNKTVKVIGQVNNKFSYVDVSGFSLVDNETYILIKSKLLPEKGSNVTVKGTLQKGAMGYWILAKEIYENNK